MSKPTTAAATGDNREIIQETIYDSTKEFIKVLTADHPIVAAMDKKLAEVLQGATVVGTSGKMFVAVRGVFQLSDGREATIDVPILDATVRMR